MNSVYIERRRLAGTAMGVLATDITNHLYTRQLRGVAIVVAEEPFLLLRVARKRWLQLVYAVQRERARTLNAARIAELSMQATYMQRLHFAAKIPSPGIKNGIFFVDMVEFPQIAAPCHTIYLAQDLPSDMMRGLQSIIQADGLVVAYESNYDTE